MVMADWEWQGLIQLRNLEDPVASNTCQTIIEPDGDQKVSGE